jgi:hypothetical protein
LDFIQVPTDTDKAMKSSMIKGTFTIYRDGNNKDLVWAIFKRSEGNLFLFKELFEEFRTYNQINENLLEK